MYVKSAAGPLLVRFQRLSGALRWRPEQTALLSNYRLHLAWVASNLAWVTIAALVLVVFLRVGHNAPQDQLDVWSILAVAGVGNLLTASRPWRRWIRESASGWPFYVWAGLLLAFNSLIVYFSRGVTNEIYLVYFPVILFAVAMLEPWAALAAITLSIVSHGVLLYGNGEEIGAGELLLRSATFLAVGFMGAYIAGAQRQELTRSAVLYEELRRKEEARGQLLAKVISAQEEERKRVARELHDDAVQSLSAVIMSLGATEESLPDSMESMRHRVAGTRDMMVRAVGEIRKIILDLRPSTLDDLGLVPALRAYAEGRLQSAGVGLEWHARGLSERLPSEMEVALFRIVQEAVNNVARHSHARKAAITLTRQDSRVVAIVEDDGDGFDAADLGRRSQVGAGLGLLGIRERASLFGGDVDIYSRPGEGTRLRVEIPLHRNGDRM